MDNYLDIEIVCFDWPFFFFFLKLLPFLLSYLLMPHVPFRFDIFLDEYFKTIHLIFFYLLGNLIFVNFYFMFSFNYFFFFFYPAQNVPSYIFITLCISIILVGGTSVNMEYPVYILFHVSVLAVRIHLFILFLSFI